MLARVAFIHAANRRCIAVIPAICESDVLQPYRVAESWIESEPAERWDEDLQPGVRSLSADDLFDAGSGLCGTAGHQVSGDIAGRQTTHSKYSKNDVRKVLAHAGSGRQGIAQRR